MCMKCTFPVWRLLRQMIETQAGRQTRNTKNCDATELRMANMLEVSYKCSINPTHSGLYECVK